MYHTYVMGIDNSIWELQQHGFAIQNDGGNYTVSFPKSKAEMWENICPVIPVCTRLQNHIEVYGGCRAVL